MPTETAPPTLTQRVAAILTKARIARGIDVITVAGRTEIDYETARRKLNGVGPLTIVELFAICAAVGETPSGVLAAVEADLASETP